MTDEIRQERAAPTEGAATNGAAPPAEPVDPSLDQILTAIKALFVELIQATGDLIADSDRRVVTEFDKLFRAQEASDEVVRLLAERTEAVLAAVETSSESEAPALDQLKTHLKVLFGELARETGETIAESDRRAATEFDKLVGAQEASDEVVRLLAERMEAVLAAVETSSESEAGTIASSARLENQIRVFNADLERWRKVNRNRGRWLTIAGGAVAIPTAIFLGLLVQHQFEPITVEDPTHGWSAHVWQNHGQAIKKCMILAARERRPVNCQLTATPPK